MMGDDGRNKCGTKGKDERPVPRDPVDDILAAWARERPDLDVSTVAVVSRITRLSVRFTQALETTFAAHGLTKATFEALAALRRSGAPYRLSQTELMQVLSLTAGTVSVRIARLVDDGLAERFDDPTDRRNVIVALTPAGEAAFDDVVHDHLATERRLLEALEPGERDLLAGLLRRLLLAADAMEAT
jgi:DNA-binding MarR family transcriptional regulator